MIRKPGDVVAIRDILLKRANKAWTACDWDTQNGNGVFEYELGPWHTIAEDATRDAVTFSGDHRLMRALAQAVNAAVDPDDLPVADVPSWSILGRSAVVQS